MPEDANKLIMENINKNIVDLDEYPAASLIHNRCEFADRQVIRLQETPDAVPDGQTPHTVSLSVYDELVDVSKPGDRLVVTGIFRSVPVRVNPRQRAVKSPAELDYMRVAGRIVGAMHARIVERVEPGMRKNDLVAEILDAGIRGVDGHGGDYAAIVPLLPSGAAAAAPHLTWDDKPMRAGEGTFFEIAGCYRRYHCPLSRTVFLGRPSQAFLDAEKATLEGMDAGLAAAERYGWPRRQGEKAPLVEEYTYSNIKTNVGLTNADFDTSNRNYGFGR